MDTKTNEILSKWQVEIKKGFAKPIILALLEEKPNYPYSLTKEISTRTSNQIIIAGSNIYPILKNLQDEGLIIGDRTGSSHDNTLGKSKGPTRTIYSLTQQGKILLIELRKFTNYFVDLVHPFIINLGETK